MFFNDIVNKIKSRFLKSDNELIECAMKICYENNIGYVRSRTNTTGEFNLLMFPTSTNYNELFKATKLGRAIIKCDKISFIIGGGFTTVVFS